MKYKKQVLTKVDAINNQLEYVLRKLESGSISAVDVVSVLRQQIKQVGSVRDTVEAESG